MGAYSSLVIKQSDADRLWRDLLKGPSDVDIRSMVRYFDTACEPSLYNVVVVPDTHYESERRSTNDSSILEECLHRYIAEHRTLFKDLPDTQSENQLLRRLLAVARGSDRLYTDDGELQDNTEAPFIDYLRDSAEEIRDKIVERNKKKLENLTELLKG